MRRDPVSMAAEARAVASSAVVEAGPAEAAAMPAAVAAEAPVAMPEGLLAGAGVARSVAGAEEAVGEPVASPEAAGAEPAPSGLPLRAARHRDSREGGLPPPPLSPVRRKWGIRSGRVERRVRIADRSS